jgi:hypothetical protein
VIVWGGELFRGGLWYATHYGLGLFSVDTQQYVLDRLIQGYIAADFNNAMILLDYLPSYQFFSSTPFVSFMSNVQDYSTVPYWSSSFGTTNVIGMWWFDWGMLTFVLCFVVGMLLGAMYKVAERTSGSISFTSILFIVAYPGIWSLTRINYFAETIFMIPFVFIILAFIGVDTFTCRSSGPRNSTNHSIFSSDEQRHGYLQLINGSGS